MELRTPEVTPSAPAICDLRSAIWKLRPAIVVILALISNVALADDLSVDKRTVRVDEPVTIIVSLEGPFAAANESLNVPVKNLEIGGSPSVSSEVSWINGSVTRRKVFRFAARPLQPGAAMVGPLVVNGEGGQRETLAAVSLDVVADRASESNDPLTILHELLATGREPIFVVSELDRTSAWVGEEVVVTWYLYNAASVEQWQIAGTPTLADFWSEEIDVRNEPPQQVTVGDVQMQKLAIRRLALFPLHSGTITIGGTGVNAQVMRRMDNGPISLFEGALVETGFESAPVNIEVKPLPPGPAPDVIGSVTLRCTAARQSAGGPVAMTVTVSGRANLRGIEAPRFLGPVDGDVQIEPLPLSVGRTGDGVLMTRKWQYLIFPARSGSMQVPPVGMSVFDPATAKREELRCGGATVAVTQAAPPQSANAKAGQPPRSWRDLLPWMAGAALGVVAIIAIVAAIRAAMRTRSEVRALVAGASAAGVRDRVAAWLHENGVDSNALAAEASDRGDAYRAFRSLVDSLEHERIDPDRAELEIRVRDLVKAIR